MALPAFVIGTAPRTCDILQFKNIATTSTSIDTVLDKDIGNGQRFYVTIQATNAAGVITVLSSDGVTVDTSPPRPGAVIDGYDKNIDFLFEDQKLTARWFEFQDEESGIQYYEVAVCDSRDLNNCPQPYVGVNLATNVTITGLDLDSGVHYVFKVRGTNMVGLQSKTNSDGFTVDFTPPVTRKVWVGEGSNHEGYQADSSSLKAR